MVGGGGGGVLGWNGRRYCVNTVTEGYLPVRTFGCH